MSVTLVGTSWNWNDSGHLQIAQPAGLQAGDLVIAALANHADSNVGAGFVQDAGMPAVTDLFLNTYPHPGVGGTMQFKYWTYALTDPAIYGWTCAAILDIGAVAGFRPSAGSVSPVTHSTTTHAATTSSTTSAVTGAASEFGVGIWYTATGGGTVVWTGDPSDCTILNITSPGTLPLTMLVTTILNVSGTFTKTATTNASTDSLANMTVWTGDLVNPCVPTANPSLLPLLGVGT